MTIVYNIIGGEVAVERERNGAPARTTYLLVPVLSPRHAARQGAVVEDGTSTVDGAAIAAAAAVRDDAAVV